MSAKSLTDRSYALSIQKLARAGFLEPGRHSITVDSLLGRRTLFWEADCTGVTLQLNSGTLNGSIDLDVCWTPCNFGGERPWFLCPETNCRNRVGILYWIDDQFACRRCHDLAYASQRESEDQRAARRANKLRAQLGLPQGLFNFALIDKPKGMHAATYDRLLDRYRFEESRACALMAKRLGMAAYLINDVRKPG